MENLIYFLTFLVSAIFDALTGGGGGVLIVPVLLYNGIDPIFIPSTISGVFIGISFFSFLKIKTSGCYKIKKESFFIHFSYLIGIIIGLFLVFKLDKDFLALLLSV